MVKMQLIWRRADFDLIFEKTVASYETNLYEFLLTCMTEFLLQADFASNLAEFE